MYSDIMWRKCLLCATASVALFTACDQGDIYPEEIGYETEDTHVIQLTGTLKGLDTWNTAYSIVLAVYESSEADKSSMNKVVSTDADGHLSVNLRAARNLPVAKLCLFNRNNVMIAQYAQSEIAANADTVRFDVGEVDVSMYTTIQHEIFNASCASCHGAGERVACRLDLTAANSYNNLVGVPSVKVDGSQRVEPGNAAGSVLHKVINSNIPEVAMPHADILDARRKSDLLSLIDSWINNLDKN